MKTSIKYLSDTKVEVKVTLGIEELAIAEEVALKKLGQEMKIPGFRKGKAPISAISKNVDQNILQERIINEAISNAVASSYLDNNLQALERPFVDVKKFVSKESLEFIATSEILPKIKVGDYKKLKYALDKIEVSNQEIDDVVERIRQSLSQKKEVDRPAKIDDEVVIDFVGKRNGKPFDGGTGKDYSLKLGSGQFIPGFEDQLVNHKAGEEFDINVTFPKDYYSNNLKGAEVVFSIKLHKVLEISLPEINDEFAAKVGPFTTAEEMKADIRRELTKQKEREANEKIKDELLEQLIDKSEIPVPEILLKDQIQSIEQDFVNNLTQQGLTLQNYIDNKKFDSKEDWIKKEVEPAAVKRVKIGLVLAELTKLEKIQASNDEITQHINLYKQQYANNAEALKQFDLPEVQRDIANRLLTEKTVDRLVELNKK